MSAPVPLGYAESGDCTESDKDPTQNKITRDPGDACAEQRQEGEQSKFERLGVHSRSRLEGAATRLPLLARVDGLEPAMKYLAVGRRPSFWERPSHALPDRDLPAAGHR